MLILAGVSISLIIGNNGLFKKLNAGAKAYKDSSDKEQNELNGAENDLDNILTGNDIENSKEDDIQEVPEVKTNMSAQYLIFDVSECLSSSGNGSVINEIEVYDKNDNKVNLNISTTEAYDSDNLNTDTNTALPYYWNRIDCWGPDRLIDGINEYSSNSSTIMCYKASHNSSGYTRFLVKLPQVKLKYLV